MCEDEEEEEQKQRVYFDKDNEYEMRIQHQAARPRKLRRITRIDEHELAKSSSLRSPTTMAIRLGYFFLDFFAVINLLVDRITPAPWI